MAFNTSTPIRGPSLGTPEAIADWAIATGAARPDDVRSYLATMYRICTAHGLAFHVAVAQSIHETTDQGIPWNSTWWRNRCNPAGIGITGDTRQNAVSRDFLNGEAAARAQFLHLWLYAVGTQPPTGLSTTDDPRWNAAIHAGYAGIAPTLGDLTNRWAADATYGEKIAGRLNELEAAGLLGGELEESMAITFHKVPPLDYVDKTYISKNKKEGVGWDNLGQRKPKFVALHRMLGSLNSTENFFAPPTSPHLTDFALGVAAQDGKARAGEIDQYNDPLGYKSGWASGRVSAPYGDGKAIVQKYGINAVNRDGISVEISGYQKTPIDDEAWAALVHFCAYWVDFMEIPFDSLPLNPHTGINAFIWHQEFTIGTGKECPFEEVMRRTDELYRDTATFLKPYQTGGGVIIPLPEEPEVPKPQYAKPLPIAELTQYADRDRDVVTALATREVDQFIYVADRVEATQDTPRLQYAAMSAPHVGPVLKKGEPFEVTWMVKAGDGNWYYVTDWWTRIRVDHTKRIGDASQAA